MRVEFSMANFVLPPFPDEIVSKNKEREQEEEEEDLMELCAWSCTSEATRGLDALIQQILFPTKEKLAARGQRG